jgi:hypothetical protein
MAVADEFMEHLSLYFALRAGCGLLSRAERRAGKERLEGCIKLLPVASNKSEHGGWWQYLEPPCVCVQRMRGCIAFTTTLQVQASSASSSRWCASANSTLKHLRLVKVWSEI